MIELRWPAGSARKVLAAALMMILLVPLTWQVRAASASAGDPAFDEWELLRALNARRNTAGLPPLRMQPGLQGIARNWSARMAARDEIGQNPNLFEEIDSSVTRPPYAVAENVAKQFSVSAVDQSFWDNPSLRAVVLGHYQYVGIGVVWNGTALWATVDFLQPSQTLATVAPPVAWYLRNANSTGPPDGSFDYGDNGDRVLTCDWDGDGTATPALFRMGTWYIRNSNTSRIGEVAIFYGDAGDVPICGDWNGDGTDSVGVFRQGNVYLRNVNTSGIGQVNFAYGDVGDVALAGDWNGDGTDSIGVFRQGNVYLRNVNTSGIGQVNFAYGDVGDVALAGDWNGDGTDSIGVARGS